MKKKRRLIFSVTKLLAFYIAARFGGISVSGQCPFGYTCTPLVNGVAFTNQSSLTVPYIQVPPGQGSLRIEILSASVYDCNTLVNWPLDQFRLLYRNGGAPSFCYCDMNPNDCTGTASPGLHYFLAVCPNTQTLSGGAYPTVITINNPAPGNWYFAGATPDDYTCLGPYAFKVTYSPPGNPNSPPGTPGFAFTIKAGDILVGNDGNSTVIKIDPNTGEQTLVATFTTATTNGVQYGGVHDLALSPSGDLIVLQHAQTVSKVNLLTGATTNLTSEGLLGTHALDTFLAGLAVAPNGDIYVSVYASPYTGIVKVDPNTGAQSSVASGGYVSGPIGIGFTPSGELMVADIYARQVYGIDTVSHSQRMVATNFPMSSPWGMTIDSAGNIYLGSGGDSDTSTNLWKVTQAGAMSIAASGGYLDVPLDVALEPSGTLLSFQTKSNAVVRINPTNNTQTIVSRGGLLSGSLSLIVAPFSVPPSNTPAQLNLQMYPGISIQGTVGGIYNIQYSDTPNGSNWLSLTNLVLPRSPYLYFDVTSTSHANRYYRAVAQ